MTDTMRAKNSELIFAAINKAPPEAVGPLLNLALEISDLPNKDLLLQQIRTATGVPELNDNLTQQQREDLAAADAEAKKAEEQKQAQIQDTTIALEQAKLQAEITLAEAKAKAALQDADQKGFQIGAQVAQQTRNNNKEDNYVPRGKASDSKSATKGIDNNPAKQGGV